MTRAISVLFLILNLTIANTVYAQRPALDSLITNETKRLHIPGFEAIAINDGKIVWTGYYGYQSIEQNIPVTSQTIFEAASTSKTITAAVMMRLYAEKKFKLDDDINKYLDFKLINPRYPKTPITFRQLLRHRSSISDNVDYLSQFWETNNGDPKISLKNFVTGYFAANGKHYDKEKNFHTYPPGAETEYSNMGIALLGYLAERMTGLPFEKYCRKNIFNPLGMDQSGWFLREVNSSNLAMPYSYSDSLKRNQPWGFGGFPDYPAGSLHTNVTQFAHFLIAWTQQGKWNGKKIFNSDAIQTLTPDEFNLGFYTWFLYATRKGALLYMHTGKANGVSSFISYSPGSKKGVIFLCNGDIVKGDDWRRIIDALYENAF